MASTLHIALSEPFATYVEAGDYGVPAEYVRELILADQDRRSFRLENRLLENLKSRPLHFSHEELQNEDFVALCRSRLHGASE